MLIIDAQVHIWGADTPKRPWPAGEHGRAHRPQPFSKDDLLREMDGSVGLFRAEVAGAQASRPHAGQRPAVHLNPHAGQRPAVHLNRSARSLMAAGSG
jgi:hypothetical protein